MPILPDDDDPMQMIRHDDPFIQGGMRKVVSYIPPAGSDSTPRIVQRHATIDHGPEQRAASGHTNRHKIHPAAGIVVPAQPNRTAMMIRRIILRGAAMVRPAHSSSPHWKCS